MKKTLCIATFLISFINLEAAYAADKLANFFAGSTAHCFILYDVNNDKLMHRDDGDHCEKQMSPAVNFLLPLALIAFDSKTIANNEQIKWHGQTYENKLWQQDQTPSSWVKNNVSWVSELIVHKIGAKTIESYLKKLKYGNQDISSGLAKFWHNGESLKISANQQFHFIRDFSSYKLPFSRDSIDSTKKLFLLDTNNGWQIIGKAGAGSEGENKFGWFIGEVSNGKDKYVFVANILGTKEFFSKECPGCKTREITKNILTSLKLF